MPKAVPARSRVGHAAYYVRAVGSAIDIIEFLGQCGQPAALAQVAEAVRHPRSSVFRILCTLEQKGLLERRAGELFTLSCSGFALHSDRLVERLKRAAQPAMRDLSLEFRETVSLAFLRQHHIEIVDVIDSPQRIRMYNVVGGIIPPNASSVGKCITAHQPEAVREHLLTAYGMYAFTPRTITGAAKLEQEFTRVREQGYAVDREESTIGGFCFGAPIRVSGGRVVAAVSISLPEARLGDERELVEAVRRTARAVSEKMKAG